MCSWGWYIDGLGVFCTGLASMCLGACRAGVGLAHRGAGLGPPVEYFLLTVLRRCSFCGSFMLFLSFYAPNFGKVEGANCFRLVRPSVFVSMRPSVRPLQNLLRYGFEISYMESSSKIIDT